MFESNCIVLKGICTDAHEMVKVGNGVRRVYTVEVKNTNGKRTMTTPSFYIKSKNANDFFEGVLDGKEIRLCGALRTLHGALFVEAESLETR